MNKKVEMKKKMETLMKKWKWKKAKVFVSAMAVLLAGSSEPSTESSVIAF